MGDGGVKKRAGDLGAEGVMDFEPAAVEHGLGGRREPK
jgi:hypothetical protein